MYICNESITIMKKIYEVYRSVYGEDLVKVGVYDSYVIGDFGQRPSIDTVAIVKGDWVTLQKQLEKVWGRFKELELEYGIILSTNVMRYDAYVRYKRDPLCHYNIVEEVELYPCLATVRDWGIY